MKKFSVIKISTISSSFLVATNNPSKLYEEMDGFYENGLIGFERMKHKIVIKEYV